MPHWYTILLVTAAVLVLKAMPPTRLMPVRLIGVVYHEVGHWLFAAVTWSNPSPVRVPWKKTTRGILYGEVRFTPGTFTTAMVALSPLVFTPWAVAFLLKLDPVSALMAAPVLAHGFPSTTDWKTALAHPLSWPLAVFVVCASTFAGLVLWQN